VSGLIGHWLTDWQQRSLVTMFKANQGH